MSFGLFKKKKEKIHSPVKGTVIHLKDVPDEVFSSGMMGAGFAVKPEDGEIYAPVSGKVLSIFPTKHALLIQSKNGKELLIHIGIDTVELKGNGFEIHVVAGQEIKANQHIASVDLTILENAHKNTDVMVVFPESKLELSDQFDYSNTNDVIGEI